MILVISLQLGFDQMPDASSANVTSYVVWFMACLYAGNGIHSLCSNRLLGRRGKHPIANPVSSVSNFVMCCVVLRFFTCE